MKNFDVYSFKTIDKDLKCDECNKGFKLHEEELYSIKTKSNTYTEDAVSFSHLCKSCFEKFRDMILNPR